MSGDKKLADLRLGASLSRLGIQARGGPSRGKGPTRLSSLKPARDLTLGSAGSVPKRSFVPNLQARRAPKDESSDQKSEAGPAGRKNDYKERGRGRGRGRGGGRGRGRGRGEIVMSQGIFSQGPFALKRTVGEAVSSSSYSSSSDRNSNARSKTSVIVSGKGDTEDDEGSKKVLQMLSDSGRMEIDDDELKEGGLMPITVPLANPKLLNKHLDEAKLYASPTKNFAVKTEPDLASANVKPKLVHTKAEKPQLTCGQLFASNFKDEKLLFLQFPDALPIKPLSHQTDHDQSEAATKTSITKLEKELEKFSFKNVSEGFVGKLVIHQSGRVRMMLGNASLDVNMGTPCGFLQDLMAITIDDNKKDMTCLGHIDHRIICVPDFEELVGSAAL